ncbi:MAG: ribonuclease P protein component [Candidatus Levybacteria bacterium]|nr:ribonuclease P protein component [Candidatus Levybacteria bacterium]
MLKTKYRLSFRKKIDFTHTKNFPFFALKTASNKLLYSRFGFVVSKKVEKRAVVRNRIKRIFRKCLEDNLEEIKKGLDVLFIIKKNIEKEENLCFIIKNILKKEKLIK